MIQMDPKPGNKTSLKIELLSQPPINNWCGLWGNRVSGTGHYKLIRNYKLGEHSHNNKSLLKN